MVPWWLYIFGFLIGSIPCGWLVAKARGIEIREHGSGNIGSTNVGRVLGRKWGMLCFAFDVLKGLAPVILAGQLAGTLGDFAMPPEIAFSWLAVGVAAIFGHMFCPWLGFKGGKGVATALGAFLGFWPALTLPMAGSFVLWLIIVGRSRYVSLGSVIGSAMFPVNAFFAFLLREPHHSIWGTFSTGGPFLLVALAMSVVVIWAHRANIRRLKAGTELKIGILKPSAAAGSASATTPT